MSVINSNCPNSFDFVALNIHNWDKLIAAKITQEIHSGHTSDTNIDRAFATDHYIISMMTQYVRNRSQCKFALTRNIEKCVQAV